jgi:iron complex transport system ATP-binding protein
LSAALLETRALTVTVPDRVLVDNLDLTVSAGEFIALLGGNGTGKSLLLRTLAGLRAASAGEVRLEGVPITQIGRKEIAMRLGFLPQDPDAPPQGTLRESVLLGRFAHLGLWDVAGAGDVARVAQALDATALGPFAARDLATLSGGEQRRAAVARLLVQAPAIYLLDEPTNHLDPAQQLAILEKLRALARAGAAVVASLHEPNLALRFADRACLLAGDGAAQVIPCAALDAAQLKRLYGLDYLQAQVGAHRFVTPG